LQATKPQESTPPNRGSGLNNYVNRLFDQSLEWKDIKWLQSFTKLPIVVKGILTAEDAIIAADLGVAAILVSNHGARQIDGTPASVSTTSLTLLN
jgi:(S)-2-hydroxy-acid oxidase